MGTSDTPTMMTPTELRHLRFPMVSRGFSPDGVLRTLDDLAQQIEILTGFGDDSPPAPATPDRIAALVDFTRRQALEIVTESERRVEDAQREHKRLESELARLRFEVATLRNARRP